MPGYDRTGPWGQGSRRGGGFGLCGSRMPSADADLRFQGKGARDGGRGLLRGHRRGFCFFGRDRAGSGYGPRGVPEAIPTNLIKSTLEAEAANLRRRLDAVERRLAGMGDVDEAKPTQV